jgi:hypothetical protein
MHQTRAARLGRSAAQLRDASVAVEDIACERLSVVSCVPWCRHRAVKLSGRLRQYRAKPCRRRRFHQLVTARRTLGT